MTCRFVVIFLLRVFTIVLSGGPIPFHELLPDRHVSRQPRAAHRASLPDELEARSEPPFYPAPPRSGVLRSQTAWHSVGVLRPPGIDRGL